MVKFENEEGSEQEKAYYTKIDLKKLHLLLVFCWFNFNEKFYCGFDIAKCWFYNVIN